MTATKKIRIFLIGLIKLFYGFDLICIEKQTFPLNLIWFYLKFSEFIWIMCVMI